MFKETLKLFFEIPKPDEINYMLLFNACAGIGSEKALTSVKRILKKMPIAYNSHSKVLTSAFDAFIKCGDISSAEQLFFNMKRNAISYAILMQAYNKDDQPHKTLDLYKQMQIDTIEPDSYIYVFLLNACADIGTLSISQSLFQQIQNSFIEHPHIKTSLIDMWVRVFIKLLIYFYSKIFHRENQVASKKPKKHLSHSLNQVELHIQQ